MSMTGSVEPYFQFNSRHGTSLIAKNAGKCSFLSAQEEEV